jgi:hypothetical protein
VTAAAVALPYMPMKKRISLNLCFFFPFSPLACSHQMSPSSSQPDQSHFSGIAMVEELLNDSALKRVCTRWLRWALQEAGALPAAVTEAARRLSKTLEERAGWDCGPLQELRGTFEPRGAYGGGRHAYRYYEEDEDEDEEGPVLVEGVELNEFGEVVVE